MDHGKQRNPIGFYAIDQAIAENNMLAYRLIVYFRDNAPALRKPGDCFRNGHNFGYYGSGIRRRVSRNMLRYGLEVFHRIGRPFRTESHRCNLFSTS